LHKTYAPRLGSINAGVCVTSLRLAAGDHEANQITEQIGQQVDLSGESAT
jgi:hypothetical protein